MRHLAGRRRHCAERCRLRRRQSGRPASGRSVPERRDLVGARRDSRDGSCADRWCRDRQSRACASPSASGKERFSATAVRVAGCADSGPGRGPRPHGAGAAPGRNPSCTWSAGGPVRARRTAPGAAGRALGRCPGLRGKNRPKWGPGSGEWAGGLSTDGAVRSGAEEYRSASVRRCRDPGRT